METLLTKELLYTQQFIESPTEENKVKLLNVKKDIIREINMTGGGNVKQVCEGYFNECREKLIKQYDSFNNLLGYLEDKEDVSSILKVMNEIGEQLTKC